MADLFRRRIAESTGKAREQAQKAAANAETAVRELEAAMEATGAEEPN